MLDKCIKRCYFLIGLKDYLYSDLLFGYKAFMKGKLMNKCGHVTVTKRLTPKLKKRHDFALRLGSIMPDILLHIYILRDIHGILPTIKFQEGCSVLKDMAE